MGLPAYCQAHLLQVMNKKRATFYRPRAAPGDFIDGIFILMPWWSDCDHTTLLRTKSLYFSLLPELITCGNCMKIVIFVLVTETSLKGMFAEELSGTLMRWKKTAICAITACVLFRFHQGGWCAHGWADKVSEVSCFKYSWVSGAIELMWSVV